MKRRVLILRVGALASSALLLGGYVWYRARADPPAAPFPGTKSAPVFAPRPTDDGSTPPEGKRSADPGAKERALLSGSKSARIVTPEDVSTPVPIAPPEPWRAPEVPAQIAPEKKPQGPK